MLAAVACSSGPKDGVHTLRLMTTDDIHGTWFDSTYTDGNVRKSIMGIYSKVDSVRKADGAENVLLVDAGDCLQGDNAAYYYNYIDTSSVHLFSRLVDYMGYDAIALGNHDIETGHPVYDRVTKELQDRGIAVLSGNAFRPDGSRYFPYFKMFERSGLRVAVLGYNNAAIKTWLPEKLWSGMEFKSLIPLVQEDVDMVRAKEKPDVVIVVAHTGYGNGDGSILEAQAADLFKSLRGVDFVVCGHDHKPRVEKTDSIALLNSGSHSRFVALGTLSVTVNGGKVVSKSNDVRLIPVGVHDADPEMAKTFRPDYEAVKAFTLMDMGELRCDLATNEPIKGMCPYINLIHTLELSCPEAQISFAAPLTYDKTIPAGRIVYNDLFTIYPFENQLYIARMTGQEIKNALEYSYEGWINTVAVPGKGHVLKIQPYDDPRNQQKGWSFTGRTYNFDSAAGINYTVDVTKPYGERVNITTLADGEAFSLDKEYNVALTSYRASGGGAIIPEGAGIKDIEPRIVARYPEIRELLYDYLKKNVVIDPARIADESVLGHWDFVPSPAASAAIAKDFALVFGE